MHIIDYYTSLFQEMANSHSLKLDKGYVRKS